MLHNCWWKEKPGIVAVLGLLGWRNIIVVCDVIQSLVRCLSYSLLSTWYMTRRDTDSLLIGLQLSSSACLIYSDILWNCHVDLEGNLKQADRAGPQDIILLCSEVWSCEATTVDFFGLIDGAHWTRNIFKLRFMCSAHDGESQTMHKYELGECLWVCVCVCCVCVVCVFVCFCVTCCLISTYSTRGGCLCKFSVFATCLHSRSLPYMANVFWLCLCKYKHLKIHQYLIILYFFKYTLI